jgi:hypothetical protein
VNIIEGPGPSSVATRVMGTGLLVNLGREAWRDRLGRWEAADGGRPLEESVFRGVLSGSLREEDLLPTSEEAVFNDEAIFETEGGFVLGVSV